VRERILERVREGQRIVVVGLGGVGSIVARYASVFFASLGKSCHLVLVDGDSFEPKNAERMIFPECGPKAEVIANEIRERCGYQLLVSAITEYVTPVNAGSIILRDDIVFMCVDNHATRKVIAEHCEQLTGPIIRQCGTGDIFLVSGGNDGVEGKKRGTFGTVQLFYRREGVTKTPTLSRFHPEIANPVDKLPTELSCIEMISSTPQVLFANLAVASMMLNAAYTVLSGEHHFAEVVFDIVEARADVVKLPGVAAERAV